MKNKNNGILTGLKPTRLLVPELGETPTSMTLYPRFVEDDANLSLSDNIPEPKVYYNVEIELKEISGEVNPKKRV